MIVRAAAVVLTALLLTMQPVLAAMTTDEAGQLDVWDPVTQSTPSGQIPAEPAPQTVCSYDARQNVVLGIDAVLACARPEMFGRDASGQTYCNVYAMHVMQAIFPDDMASLADILGPNHPSVLADNFFDYFSTHWAAVPATLTPEQRFAAAQRFADAGYVVVASEPGHIGFVQASAVPLDQVTTDNILLSQGGATAGRGVPLSQAWTASALDSAVTFFYRRPGAAPGIPPAEAAAQAASPDAVAPVASPDATAHALPVGAAHVVSPDTAAHAVSPVAAAHAVSPVAAAHVESPGTADTPRNAALSAK